jgi:CO/xanthine dehydrogenase Mo-binding subunit
MSQQLIGKSINRIDAEAKVTGKAVYPGDMDLPNMTYLKIVFAEIPHAIIKKIDVSSAEKLNGVIRILTAKDVPCNEYGLIESDQPVLCGIGSDKLHADHVRFIGDQIAFVIAENKEIAEEAANLIKATYKELPVVENVHKAIKDNSVLLHPEKKSNVFCEYNIRRGNIDTGFAEADVVIEGKYRTPLQEHAYLQPEAGIAYFDEDGRVTVVASGQWVHEDREQIAHALKIPEETVRVIYPAIGGAFGGREDLSIQIALGLSVLKLKEMGIHRPVKTIWSRRESIIGHHKRHPYFIKTRWGVKKDGRLTAIEAELVADGGAYMYTSTKVMANATLMINGPYYVPNIRVNSKAVYTNNIPNGAFRGFGGPQACFAAEMQMNKLADALGMDPVKLRLLNAIKEGQPTSVGTPLPKGISIEKVIKVCAKRTNWRKKSDNHNSKLLKGVGFAAGYKNVGFSFGAPESCWVRVKIIGKKNIDKVELFHAGADVGQGAHSLFVQIAADIIDVPLEKVLLTASDTAFTDDSGSASASRMTFMAGNAIIGAAKEAKEKWLKKERPADATYVFKPPKTSPYDKETGECTPNFAYGYVAESVEVEVDTETGKVNIIKIICADDVGKAINPIQVKGQIEGALVQAAGYSVLENFIQKEGKVLTDSLATYLIPTIMDIPETTVSIIVEEPDPLGPEGARGMGEMPFMPLAPAIAAALHNATGVWFDEFPFTEEIILRGLGILEG